jgi:cytochrome c oxidase subunit 2
VLVISVILYCAWQFHMRPGEELKDGPPIHGNTRLEVFWTAMPAALLLGLLSYSFVVLHDNEKKPAHEILIGVTGQQFAWTFQYGPSVTGGRPVQAYELYLPNDVPVKFELHSRDVIHAFWIPAFRLQEDIVPGITTSYRATPVRLGTYPIVCNLLCGLGHSLMRSRVHVLTPEQFSAWLRSKGVPGTGSALTQAVSSAGATSRATTTTTAGAASGAATSARASG